MTATAFRGAAAAATPGATLGVNRRCRCARPVRRRSSGPGRRGALPPVIVKSLFGEFAARPGRAPGAIEIEPVPGRRGTWRRRDSRSSAASRATSASSIQAARNAMTAGGRRPGLTGDRALVQRAWSPRHIGWSEEHAPTTPGGRSNVNLADNYRGQTPHRIRGSCGYLWRDGVHWGGRRCPTATTSSSTERRLRGLPGRTVAPGERVDRHRPETTSAGDHRLGRGVDPAGPIPLSSPRSRCRRARRTPPCRGLRKGWCHR